MPKRIDKNEAPKVSKLSDEELGTLAADYISKQEEAKSLKKDTDEVKSTLDEQVKNHGAVNPKGHKVLVADYNDKEYIIMNERRVSNSLVPEALDLIRKHLPKEDAEYIIEQQPVLRVDRLEELIKKGKIKNEVLVKLFTESESFAFKVKVEKDKDKV